MSSSKSWQFPLDILSLGLSLPSNRIAIDAILEREAPRVSSQLGALTYEFRSRLMPELGIATVLCDPTTPSRIRGRAAAEQALKRTELSGKDLGLVVDFSTFADDAPGIWSLGHDIQCHLQASDALVLGTRGSGCCGLHLALRTAQAFFCANADLDFALLVAADRAWDLGRACLPISIMADAASALVVARVGRAARRIGLVRAVTTQSSGRFVDVISTEREASAMSVDAGTFEQQILPLHFVMLNRVLGRALAAADLPHAAIEAVVYPNTTELDRHSVARALEFHPNSLFGPGPLHHGHAFANDLLINAQSLFDAARVRNTIHSAWLAAGSGFTWGAAIVNAVRC